MLANLFSATGLTLMSSAYTFYKIHPYVPYGLIWNHAVVPGTIYALQTIKDKLSGNEYDEESDIEMYQVVSCSEVNGIVTKYLLFDQEPQFTYLGVEYIEEEEYNGGPVFL